MENHGQQACARLPPHVGSKKKNTQTKTKQNDTHAARVISLSCRKLKFSPTRERKGKFTRRSLFASLSAARNDDTATAINFPAAEGFECKARREPEKKRKMKAIWGINFRSDVPSLSIYLSCSSSSSSSTSCPFYSWKVP